MNRETPHKGGRKVSLNGPDRFADLYSASRPMGGTPGGRRLVLTCGTSRSFSRKTRENKWGGVPDRCSDERRMRSHGLLHSYPIGSEAGRTQSAQHLIVVVAVHKPQVHAGPAARKPLSCGCLGDNRNGSGRWVKTPWCSGTQARTRSEHTNASATHMLCVVIAYSCIRAQLTATAGLPGRCR